MIYSLRGKLIYNDLQSAVIECAGVGYRFMTTPATLSDITTCNGDVSVFTHMAVKEDGVELYGFADPAELEMFKLLITVSGVGPKAGISILSAFTPDRLSLVIAGEDSKTLTTAQGIGNKTAQRIVLELKDKVGGVAGSSVSASGVAAASNSGSDSVSEAIAALITLGYSRTDAVVAVSGLDPAMSTDELIKGALKVVARQVLK